LIKDEDRGIGIKGVSEIAGRGQGQREEEAKRRRERGRRTEKNNKQN
jgi:hypothetical protein